MNTFGQHLRLTTFGESHGPAVGGVVDGMPAGFAVDYELTRTMMAERRPGASPNVSSRQETDEVEWLSGISPEGITLGSPIAFIIRNRDARPDDYSRWEHLFRPNHADYTYQAKYGVRDYRGGGRASARETAARVAAASLAMLILRKEGITVDARVTEIAGCADPSLFAQMIADARSEGDSLGGIVGCVISHLPPGLGNPIFDKLQARLAYAMLSIPGVKGFEYGDGFSAAAMRGSRSVDTFICKGDRVTTLSNHSGGIQGGISNGMPVNMRIAFKPTPTLGRPIQTIDDTGNPAVLEPRGRHDPCIALRGCAVVKAMAILSIADALLAR